MSWINHRIVRQSQQLAPYGRQELVHVSSRQVRTSDGSIKKGIPYENIASFLIIESNTSFGMSRYMQHLQRPVSNSHNIPVLNISAYRDVVYLFLNLEHPRLLPEIGAKGFVSPVSQDRRTEFLDGKGVADRVIHMKMGVDYMLDRQFLTIDEIPDGIPFPVVDHTGIDNGAFPGFRIPNHIRIDTEKAEFKLSYPHVSYGLEFNV